jgi:hypothetical protein
MRAVARPITPPRRARGVAAVTLLLGVLAGPRVSPLGAQPHDAADDALVARIREEATTRSQVVATVGWLTDVLGPRLTGSPATRAAGEWTVRTLAGWGIENARLERWGPFGRGWSSERFSLAVLAPQPYPVIAYPSAWTPGTPGPVTAEAVLVRVDSAGDLARYRGRLRGRFVLVGAPAELPPRFEPQARRYTEAELDSMAALPAPEPRPPLTDAERWARLPERVRREAELAPLRARLFADEGVAAVLLRGEGDDGTVLVSSVGGSREPGAGPLVPTAVLAAEHYGRIARTLEKGVPVTLELNAVNRFHDVELGSFNVVAELPGGDPRLAGEVVMIGAHLDSWHAGTGATDDAAGVAVMMEAMRVLKAARVPLRRTVRLALWTGEEQGLLGSRAYVARHLGDPATGRTAPAHARFSAYFNLDLGAGRIRGIYAQGNAAVAPIFGAWLAPFRAGGARTVTLASITGTDHLPFDALGLPAFQFIQDPLEYGSRSYHSNMDVFERVQGEDLRWNAAVVATFAMRAANCDGLLPRRAGARAARGTAAPPAPPARGVASPPSPRSPRP